MSTACKLQPHCWRLTLYITSSETTAWICVISKGLHLPSVASCADRDVGAGEAESMAAAMAGEA